MKDKYIPGQDCGCYAYSESECGCDADWTPAEVYELREQLKSERALADRLAEAANAVIDQWETPNWRLRESTAKYMNTLRITITAWKEARGE